MEAVMKFVRAYPFTVATIICALLVAVIVGASGSTLAYEWWLPLVAVAIAVLRRLVLSDPVNKQQPAPAAVIFIIGMIASVVLFYPAVHNVPWWIPLGLGWFVDIVW